MTASWHSNVPCVTESPQLTSESPKHQQRNKCQIALSSYHVWWISQVALSVILFSERNWFMFCARTIGAESVQTRSRVTSRVREQSRCALDSVWVSTTQAFGCRLETHWCNALVSFKAPLRTIPVFSYSVVPGARLIMSRTCNRWQGEYKGIAGKQYTTKTRSPL
jgi:hypothetical protein